jgi:hypothetical protein
MGFAALNPSYAADAQALAERHYGNSGNVPEFAKQ